MFLRRSQVSRRIAFYPGYSADFFDGQHYVMKGASPRTASLLTRPSFRNWFRPDYPYMYAGFPACGSILVHMFASAASAPFSPPRVNPEFARPSRMASRANARRPCLRHGCMTR